MSSYGFTSAFATQLDEYIAFKKNMGFYGGSRTWYLKRFDAYCAEHGRAVFDRGTVEGWVSAQLATSGPYRSWMSYIRDFGRWLNVHGRKDAYVLSDQWKAPFVPARPYLLTSHEIELFFGAAARLGAQSPWRWQAVGFFTLMHSCGIRTGEARALLVEHVDLPGRHVQVVLSKGNRSRRLPLTGEVAEVLAVCEQASGKKFGTSRRTFFVSSTGKPVTATAVGDDQPHLGPGRPVARSRWPAAPALRLPALGGRRDYVPCRGVPAGGGRASACFVRIILAVLINVPTSRASRSRTRPGSSPARRPE